ncbi:hypothetical protein ABH923_000357 [Leifsonia sp. EB41]|uniref:hypothetical protein n=1 Tax=Leifsonia sp. EB41 TaxID=3156260 RepID=UPI003516D061
MTLAILWAIVGSKILAIGVRLCRPVAAPRWLRPIEAVVPTWQLFGQAGGTYDLYAIVGDRIQGETEHFHEASAAMRGWYSPIINPNSRYRALLREALRTAAHDHVSGRSQAHNEVAASFLKRAGQWEVRAAHPRDFHERRFSVYIVLDQGHFGTTAPEAHAALGPYDAA